MVLSKKQGPVRVNFTDQQIADAMKEGGGVIAEAARLLGIPRKTMSNWVKSLVKRQSKRLDDYIPETKLKLPKKTSQTYIFTSVQNNTTLHPNFWKGLLKLAEDKNAQLVVIPVRYKNVTAFIESGDYTPWYPSETKPYTLNGPLVINKNLIVMGDFKIQATAVNPLGGVGAIGENRSVILGHAQLQMKLVPTPHYELPRILLTTGSASNKNYSASKAGKKAEFHHTLGATLCEVEGDLFWNFQIMATPDGSFYHMDSFYDGDKEPTRGHRASAIVFGDTHNDFLDPDVVSATWTNKDSIVNLLQPEHEFHHDVLDFYSQNHHHRNDIYTKFAKHHSGLGNVERELDRLVKNHNEIWGKRENTTIHYIDSNHNNAFTRWLNEADPKEDPENALLYHKMQVQMLEGIEMTPQGVKVPNPMQLYMQSRIANPEKTIFHERTDRVLIHDIDMGQHGDAGFNGARGSITSFARSGYKTTIGHSHTCGIDKGAWQTGCSCYLSADYNRRGYSSWLQAHCTVYPNGKRTMVIVINGRWRR